MIIGICDDEKHARELIESYVRKLDNSITVYHFEDGEKIMRFLRQGKRIDVLYLDIDLKGTTDGMVVASKIKGKQIKEGTGASALPLIIFVTGFPERMPEAFGVRAFHFLVKPIDEKQFGLIFDQAKRAIKYAPKGNKMKGMLVRIGGVQKTVLIPDIRYIESNGRKLLIHMGNEVVETYGTTADILKDLDTSFCQIHRSFIVNMNYISDYTRSSIQITNGEYVPMSKYKYRDFVSEYAAFLESEIC